MDNSETISSSLERPILTLSKYEDNSSRKIRLLLSVTERVKTPSAGKHLNGFETISRECTRAISAVCPQRWDEYGFLIPCWEYGSTVSGTWSFKYPGAEHSK